MKRIKILRKEYRETQKELSRFLGINQSTLSHWENGKAQPSKDMLFKIADRYGVSMDYLMEYSETREFVENDSIRLLREYLAVKTQQEYTIEQLKTLDKNITDFIQFIYSIERKRE